VSTVLVESRCRIERPVAEVRAQFADVDHHATVEVHRGVTFIKSSADAGFTAGVTRYRQISRSGPVRLVQDIEQHAMEDGSLVNRVVEGSLAGSTLAFRFAGDGASKEVTATATVDLRGARRLLAPLLARSLRRGLARALAEDKVDLESGRYAHWAPHRDDGRCGERLDDLRSEAPS
jgi:hypothetical protein